MIISEKCHIFKQKIIHAYKKYFTIEGGYDCILPDRIYLKKLYKKRLNKQLNLRTPRSFTEKLNWLKLYDRTPEYTTMVDKYAVREIIKEIIGEKYLVPLLGVWDNAHDIDFDKLPESFVLKCNHDSNVYICSDKTNQHFTDKLNNQYYSFEAVRDQLKKNLKTNYYKGCREWPYKNVKRKIIAEKFMNNTNGDDLVDYKLFCFNGVPKMIMINSGRFSEEGTKTDMYNTNWEHLDMQDGHYPFAGDVFQKPDNLDEMIKIAMKLSQGIPFLRVDINVWDGELYFGELTFFHSAGFECFQPEKWDVDIGNWLTLPKTRQHQVY